MDLVIAPGPGVPHGLVVPAEVLVERFSRSPGPGGQSVNTTDSRVELELELAAYDGFTPTQRRRVTAALGDRIVVAAREHRPRRFIHAVWRGASVRETDHPRGRRW